MQLIRKYQYQLSIAGIVAYNSWFLSPWLNKRAFLHAATTSELTVRGQPSSLFFQAAEITAALLIFLGMGHITKLGRTNWQRNLLRLAIFIFSASTIFEIFMPLDCSPAINVVCAESEKLGLLSWQHGFHIYESLASYAVIFLLPLTVFWAIRLQPKARLLKRLSLALVIAMILWAVETAIRYKMEAASYGREQHLFLLLFSCWYIAALGYSRKSSS